MHLGKVWIRPSFLIFLGILIYFDSDRLLLLVFAAAAMHEAGHLAAIRFCGGDVRELVLTPFGAEIRLSNSSRFGYLQDLLVFLSGPLVNLCCSIVCSLLGKRWNSEFLFLFAGVHFVLGLYNLLPVSILDGGQILRALSFLLFDSEIFFLRFLHYGTMLTLFAAGVAGQGGALWLCVLSLWLLLKSLAGEGIVNPPRMM